MSAPTQRLTPDDLLSAVKGVTAHETDLIATLANVSALVFEALPDLNWAGFYLLRHGELVLGPFQGRVACTRIPLGKGVCGTVAQSKTACIVPDVHAFPGHIACDGASTSEMVLPVLLHGTLFGVLDLDSPLKNRFGAAEQKLLEAVLDVVVQALSRGEVVLPL
ncbi:GAF domain-containing protein [Acetobacter orientalis]|uniref:GAF domain-containing protein n=1 Tax=Acetobacter orientalis TaxID=146474 RepID=UPI0039ED0C55